MHNPVRYASLQEPGRRLMLPVRLTIGVILATVLVAEAAAEPRNLVRNGDFSAGLNEWTVIAPTPHGECVVLTEKFCLPEQLGNPYVSLNVYWGAVRAIRQSGIVLPETPVTLRFRTWGNLDPVQARIIVVDEQGVTHTIDTFTPPITEWSEDPYDPNVPLQCTGNRDVTKSYSLAAFKGQTISLEIRATSGGTNGTFASFDDVAMLADEPELETAISLKPAAVELDDEFTVTMTVTNSGTDAVTSVTPKPLSTTGNGAAKRLSGPRPASVPELAPGASASFVYTYGATAEGKLRFKGSATAVDFSGSTLESEEGQSRELLIGPLVKLIRISSEGRHGQIVPGGKIVVIAQVEKTADCPVTVMLDPEVPLYTGLDSPVIPADATGELSVLLPARIADESNDEIYANVIDAANGDGTVSLESRIWVKFTYVVDGKTRIREARGSLRKPDDTIWSITYPDYSLVTGDPPADSFTELYYYRLGNLRCWENKPNRPVYLKDGVTRKWMLKAIRYQSTDDCTPAEPRDAAYNLARFLIDHLPFRWQGSGSELTTWARQLEAGEPHGPTACVNFAFYLGAASRVVGIRSREMNNALKYRLGWAQHATNQLWFDGKWNWFDAALAKSCNSGLPITDYPNVYFTKVKYARVFSYSEVKTWYAIDDHGYNYVLGDNSGRSSELAEPEKWAFYAHHRKRDFTGGDNAQRGGEENIVITMHSPVTTLYTDSQGRRLGALGPLTDADRLCIDSEPPLTGGGSVWEIPDAVYIAPGIHTQFGVAEACADVEVNEEIIIPIAEFGGGFTLSLTGVADGDYGVTIAKVADESEQELYATQGTIRRGQTVHLALNGAVDADTDTVQIAEDTSDARPAPSGLCPMLGAMLLMALLLPLVALRRQWRRRAVDGGFNR